MQTDYVNIDLSSGFFIGICFDFEQTKVAVPVIKITVAKIVNFFLSNDAADDG